MSKEAIQVKDTNDGYSEEGEIQDMPPGYKRTEVGIIPIDWKSDLLCNVLSRPLQNGVFNAPGKKGRGIKLINVIDLYRAIPIRNESLQLFAATSAEIKTFSVNHGDIFFTRSSITPEGIAHCNIYEDYGSGPVVFDCHLIRARPDHNKADGFFLFRYCTSSIARKYLVSKAKTTTMTTIDQNVIARLLLPLPPLAEQRAIAKALSDVDSLLGALDALIAKKRAMKQATMQQLLSGKTRLPGISGEWRSVILGEHVTFLSTGTNSRAELKNEGSVKYLHYGDIHTSNKVYLDPQITPMPCLPGERARTLNRLRNGDLVLVDASEDLAGVGKSFEITNVTGVDIVAGLHTIVARFNKSILVDGFKAYLQYCPAFRDQLKRLAAGTKVFATNRSHISNVEIQLPGIKEQAAIATILSDMDAEITALEQRRDKTQQIKQGMMQQLLTGRVRLIPQKTETP